MVRDHVNLILPNADVLSYANYGGTPVKGEYCHESVSFNSPVVENSLNWPQSLRLVLNAIALSAARYGRSITPLLSLSIDFYVRLFVRVKTSPIEVKKLSRYVLLT
jgi:tRNA (guanine26-N2/guanine27-N2)-dimethyltransferase